MYTPKLRHKYLVRACGVSCFPAATALPGDAWALRKAASSTGFAHLQGHTVPSCHIYLSVPVEISHEQGTGWTLSGSLPMTDCNLRSVVIPGSGAEAAPFCSSLSHNSAPLPTHAFWSLLQPSWTLVQVGTQSVLTLPVCCFFCPETTLILIKGQEPTGYRSLYLSPKPC